MTNTAEHPVEVVELAREPDFAIGQMVIRPCASEIVVGGVSRRVEPRVMQLLVALAQAQGQVVSRKTLLERCWHNTFVSDDALTRAVGRVRQLARGAPGAFAVETIPKIGYRLTLGPTAQTKDVDPQSSAPALRVPGSLLGKVAAVATAAMLIAATALLIFQIPSFAPAPSSRALTDETVPIGTANAEAYDRYLRAGGLLEAGGRDNLLRAEQLLREAIDLDPSFSSASERLAVVLWAAATFMPERAAEIYVEVGSILESQGAETAHDGRSHLIRGFQKTLAGDWAAADSYLAKARSEVPAPAQDAVNALEVFLYGSVGRISDSLELVERRARSRPLSREDSRVLQQWLNQAGRRDEAEREYIRSFDLPGDRSATELTALIRALGTGDRNAVERQARRYLETGWSRPGDEALFKVLDSPHEALELLRIQIDNWRAPDSMPPHLVAAWAVYFGDDELAIHSLRASPEMLHAVSVMIWEPVFAQARQSNAFKALLRDFGYVDYWRTVGAWSDFCSPIDISDFRCW